MILIFTVQPLGISLCAIELLIRCTTYILKLAGYWMLLTLLGISLLLILLDNSLLLSYVIGISLRAC